MVHPPSEVHSAMKSKTVKRWSVAAVVGALVWWFGLPSSEVKRARKELSRWVGLREGDPAAQALLARYWAAVGLPPQPAGTPWSAAFLSFVAAPALSPSSSHLGYARDALRSRQEGKRGVYWAYRPDEITAYRPGDILIRGRGQPVGWADVERESGHKDSHGDLVVESRPDGVLLLGGNVNDTVATRLRRPGDGAEPVFAVLRKA